MTSTETVDGETTTPEVVMADAAAFEEPSGDAERRPDRPPRKEARRGDPPVRPPAPDRGSPVVQGIRDSEDRSLRAMMDELGTQGAFKIQIRRDKPISIRVNGKEIKTQGHLETIDYPVDEEYLRTQHGGGTYHLKITPQGPDGSYQYKKGYHRTVEIAGDPNVDRLPSAQPPAVMGAASAPAEREHPSLAIKAFDMMQSQLDRPAKAAGPDPAIQMLIEQMNRQLIASNNQVAALSAEMTAMRTRPPEGDPVKDKILSNLLDGQSGHVEALRLRYEAELRQVKDGAIQDQKRAEDRHDREISAERRRHEDALASVRASYEREIAAVRQSHEVALAATRASSELQSGTLTRDNSRLEREITELRREVTDLKAKKDKGILEQAKEIQAIQEALGSVGGEKGSGWERLADLVTNPDALAAILSTVRGGAGAAAAAVAPKVAPAPVGPRIMRQADGTKVALMPSGEQIPVKKRPKVIAQGDGTQLVIPEIEPAQLAMVVAFLESAFTGGKEPEIVAQSYQSTVPGNILAWIREHETEQTSGVDLFLTQVAKLPGTSPLASMRGRNWVRALGKALAA